MVSSNSLNVATVFDILSILTLPGGIDSSENEHVSVEITENLKVLTPKLFKSYNRQKPSHTPIEVVPYLLVDHIEEFNELQQTLLFHATLIIGWEDRRLIWEPSDYGNLNRLSFGAYEILRFWTPGVTIKGVTLMSRHLMQSQNTEYTLTYNGYVLAEVPVTIKAVCEMDVSTYPYDNQTCSLILFTPQYSSAQVTFTATPTFLTRESLFADNNMTMTAGFKLEDLDALCFYSYGSGFTTNRSVVLSNLTAVDSLVRFQLKLRRNVLGQYISEVAIPLLMLSMLFLNLYAYISNIFLRKIDKEYRSFISILTDCEFSLVFIGALQRDSRTAIIWLMACLLIQIYINARNSVILPRDYETEPLCSKVAKFLLFETLSLIIYRMWITLQIMQLKDANDLNLKAAEERIKLIEWIVKYILCCEAFIIFWLLFL